MKLQSVATAAAAPDGQSEDPEKSLLDSLAGLAGERALILGLDIEIMCGLIQRGCQEVTEVEPGDRPEAGSVDLVIVPSVTTVDTALLAIAQARRALTAFGRVVLRTMRDPSQELSRAIPDILRLNGFFVLGVEKTANRTAFTAELSLPWEPASAPGVAQ